MEHKIIAYTAVFGDRDEPFCLKKDPAVYYMLFTDNKQNETFDETVYCEIGSSPRMKAREIKCMSHKMLPDHEFSIWFDACMKPNSNNLSNIINGLEEIGAFPHRLKFNINDIVENCIRHSWDYPGKIRKQIARYILEGIPEDSQTFETGIFLRRNTPSVNKFNELWWSEVKNGSERDQIGLPYCIWKTGMICNSLSDGITNVCNNHYFNYVAHCLTHPKKVPLL
jgi:hypothetical protein